MDIKAINFDYYGTLVDWLQVWKDVSQKIIEENMLNTSSTDFTLEWRKTQRQLFEEKEFVPFKECIESALILICKKYNFKNNDYHEFLFDKWKEIKPFPEVPETLKKLKGNYTLAICSNSSRDLYDVCAEKLPTKFDYVFISDEVKFTKPNPKIYKFALKAFRVNPKEVLHIASSQMDVKGATNAGFNVCWINRLNEKRLPEIPKPRFEIHRIDEIFEFVKNHQS